MSLCDKCQTCKNKYEPIEQPLEPPKIKSLFLGLTENCTNRCRYCFVHHNPKEMSYEMALKGMKWLTEQTNGKVVINFFGGEPMMKWDDVIVPLVLYAEKYYPNRVTYNITTNGVLLNNERILFMKEHLFNMLLSFDGVKECQDFNRPMANGKGSFDIIEPKIASILAAYPKTTMRMTVHHESVKHYYDCHKFAVERGFQSVFAAVDTFGKWTEEEYGELENQMYKVADLFISLVKLGKYMEFNPLLRGIQDVLKLEGLKSIPPKINRELPGKCGIGSNQACILAPDGNFYTCQEVFTIDEVKDHFLIGNINDGINNARRKEIYSCLDVNKFRCSTPDYCKECSVKLVCDGGCSARNYEQNRDINVLPEPYCREHNIRLKVCKYIQNELKDNELYLQRTDQINQIRFT